MEENFSQALEFEILNFLYSHKFFFKLSDAQRIIQSKFSLFPRWSQSESCTITLEREFRMLKKNHRLAYIFQFHGDGRIREAALKCMSGPIDTSLAFYGLILRLNDWVEVIRIEALQAFERCYPETPLEVAVPAIWDLILNARSWTRWSNGYSHLIETIMRRQNFVDVLVERITSVRESGTGKVLRALSESESLDSHLQRIALEALQPHVRAIALNYISTGTASWPLNKTKKIWVNKVMGDYRLVPDFGKRPISVEFDIISITSRALKDHSIIVKKEALDAIILHRTNFKMQNVALEAISALDSHPNLGINSRIAYIKAKML